MKDNTFIIWSGNFEELNSLLGRMNSYQIYLENLESTMKFQRHILFQHLVHLTARW